MLTRVLLGCVCLLLMSCSNGPPPRQFLLEPVLSRPMQTINVLPVGMNGIESNMMTTTNGRILPMKRSPEYLPIDCVTTLRRLLLLNPGREVMSPKLA